MIHQSVSVFVYIICAHVVIGLLTCSILSPLSRRTADNYTMFVYGVMVVYDVPPADQVAEASQALGDGDGVAKQIRSSRSNSIRSLDTDDEDLYSAPRSLAHGSFPVVQLSVRSENRLAGAMERRGMAAASVEVMSLSLHDRNGGLGGRSSSSSVSRTAVPASGNAVKALAEDGKNTVKVTLSSLPDGALKSSLLSYIITLCLSILWCLLLTLTCISWTLSPPYLSFLMNCKRVLSILVVLSVTACFISALVIHLNDSMFSYLGGGFYTSSRNQDVVKRPRSGFSCTVVALAVGLLIVLLSPLL